MRMFVNVNKRDYEVVTTSKSTQKDSRIKFMPSKQIRVQNQQKKTRKSCDICSKLTIMRAKRRH